ncbi:hypothetical protein [Actinomadura montaniterrae]|uniref:Uncharacterized protein n=1 Tax=Actinomadura montaniterrae TaxID=1803903 RepID=A0A6L3VCT9_9ACTN|nr:hypothetical protein [Actinomadura montaniterrae]KAB2359495.1 hypothetical protein F9B16_47045 [Actinomadura montaniterrae]
MADGPAERVQAAGDRRLPLGAAPDEGDETALRHRAAAQRDPDHPVPRRHRRQPGHRRAPETVRDQRRHAAGLGLAVLVGLEPAAGAAALGRRERGL